MTHAPVTNGDVAAAIKSIDYTVLPNGRSTVCSLTLDNGFVVLGESHCADPARFDKAAGERYAFANAYDKVSQFLGFRLADELAAKRVAR